MSSPKTNLLVIAHPDDESIFFAGLIQRRRTRPWKIICATDGNADGNGARRREDFAKACKLLKVKQFEFLGLPDRFEHRLDLDRLAGCLANEHPAQVFTHGPVGEYGHPHHQDVCLAVHRAFKNQKVFAVAYNCLPDFSVQLTPKEYAMKCKILGEVYRSETQRFLNFVPSTSSEGYCQYSLKEIEAVYRYYSQGVLPAHAELKKLRWLLPFFEIHRDNPVGPRPF